ncbi:MAG: zinc ribbon domain-containing protein [Clostridiales bacterium]|jgi:hypothetical protein|nr:zinc ribbon domain-containing protein [Clostridiales bacterium]
MKKPIKITLLVLAALTAIVVIAAAVMLKAVSGDALFYMNSTLGNIYAVSYRPVCLASVVLALFWILLAAKYRKEIINKLTKLKLGKKKTADSADSETTSSAAVFCAKCGKRMSAKSRFCPFCGEPVTPVRKEEIR